MELQDLFDLVARMNQGGFSNCLCIYLIWVLHQELKEHHKRGRR